MAPWRVRADARPNFGDYNSSELLGFNQFVMTWSDGRFPSQSALDPTLPASQRHDLPSKILPPEQIWGGGQFPSELRGLPPGQAIGPPPGVKKADLKETFS